MAQPRYQVIERIDAGGMAEVFKAEATSMQGFQKLVAIKRVLPNLTKNERFVRMFLDEAKVSLHLNHTNCVQVFDLGIADGTYFIVMEFVDGTNLKNILERMASRGEVVPVEMAVYIALEICKGLSHAHGKSDLEGEPLDIIHRDISPPNILVSKEGEVKITDFGLAKAQSQVETTDPGVVKGKFGYLSPEAANGEMIDIRTDIFAVGILLWEMLVGKRLFLGESDYDTLKLVQEAKIPPLSDHRSDVPHQLVEIVERVLAQNVQQRYQNAQQLADALAEFLFSWGRPVTAFELARLVDKVMEERKGQRREAGDSAVNEAVQREINKLVSLEEVDDLDMALAQMYESTSSHESHHSGPHDASLENPASWGLDLDMAADDAPSFLARVPGGDADTWQEAGLDELMRPENAQAAVEKSRRERAEASGEQQRVAPSQKRAAALQQRAQKQQAQRQQQQQKQRGQAQRPRQQPQQTRQSSPQPQSSQQPPMQTAQQQLDAQGRSSRTAPPSPTGGPAQAPPLEEERSAGKIALIAFLVLLIIGAGAAGVMFMLQ